MNKKLTILALPIMIFMITSILASDFNIRADGDSIFNSNIRIISHLNAWHDDGKAPTCNPNQWYNHADGTRTHCSNGIPASGKGTLEITIFSDYYIVTLNLNLKEKEVLSDQNNIVITNNQATGILWQQGLTPIKVNINNIRYEFDKNSKTVSIIFSDDNFELLGLKVK